MNSFNQPIRIEAEAATELGQGKHKDAKIGESDEIDGFASLRSLMIQLSQEQKTDAARAIEKDTESKTGSLKKRCEQLGSPPDFDLGPPDEYDIDTAAETESEDKRSKHKNIQPNPSRLRQEMNHRASHFTSNRIRCTTENERKTQKNLKGRNTDRQDSTRRPSSSLLAASMTKTRRRKLPGATSSRNSIPVDFDKSKGHPFNRFSVATSSYAENAKSIAGLRPTHWHRKRQAQENRGSSTIPKSSQQLAKSSALVAATRPSFRNSNTSRKNPKMFRNSPAESADPNNTATRTSGHSNTPSIEKTNVAELVETRSSSEVAKASFSFAPSFVSTRSTAMLDDAIGDDSGDESRVIITTKSSSFVSTPPFKRRRRSKAASGEWVRRLTTIRTSYSNDSVRLHNKAFARARTVLDVNDPRKHAKTCTDVTILGHYGGPWINVPEDMKITVLGYAHRHIQRTNNFVDKDPYDYQPQKAEEQENRNAPSEGFFAWFTFTLATARHIDLQKGRKCKIYNALVMPSRLSVTLKIPSTSHSFLKNISGVESTICCKRIVICTQLCEVVTSFN